MEQYVQLEMATVGATVTRTRSRREETAEQGCMGGREGAGEEKHNWQLSLVPKLITRGGGALVQFFFGLKHKTNTKKSVQIRFNTGGNQTHTHTHTHTHKGMDYVCAVRNKLTNTATTVQTRW